MSKASMPRPRYVAFRLEAPKPLSRRAVSGALKARARAEGWADADAPALTRYAWPNGIVRVEHLHAARARRLLAALTTADEGGPVPVRATTLSTSGTLAALTQRTGVLQARDAN